MRIEDIGEVLAGGMLAPGLGLRPRDVLPANTHRLFENAHVAGEVRTCYTDCQACAMLKPRMVPLLFLISLELRDLLTGARSELVETLHLSKIAGLPEDSFTRTGL